MSSLILGIDSFDTIGEEKRDLGSVSFKLQMKKEEKKQRKRQEEKRLRKKQRKEEDKGRSGEEEEVQTGQGADGVREVCFGIRNHLHNMIIEEA